MSASRNPAPDARLQAAEQELSEFTYIVSHDLAATFRHVRAFSDLLRQEGGFTPQQDNYCRQVQTAADKCAAMLEQLLIYSRVMRQPLKLEDCALDALLDTVRLRLGEEIRRSGAVIAAGPLGRARVDRELFVQALHQLAGNSIKFRREGVAPRLEFAVAAEGPKLRLTLCDNGIGLGDLDRERLFAMFTRGHAEGTYLGCGAGLTVARRILRRHGGEVRFAARPDGAAEGAPEGVCVEIELPRDGEKQRMTAQTLLIVDDDQAERELTVRLTRDTFPGARVEAVADALAAREACKQEAFDCVILDYNMPGMDGLACAQRLRASHPYLPIVMSTGYGDEMLAAHAVTSGVTDYIPKSRITAQSLTRVVENAIRITRQARVIDEQRNELENFAFALAHDFKQPIRQITTFANLVSEAIRDGRADEIGQHLDFLNGAARRLGSLVDVMSQYTLLSQPPAIATVDLGEVLANVRAALACYIEERGGRVTQDKAPPVRGNEALVAQVLQNLIVNGLKYNNSANPTVNITTEAASGQCVIRVKDNGIGIEPQYAEEIFKPLVRLHTKTEYSGTGLGLTLARKALAAMDGSIHCNAQAGGGTEFVVKLALAA